MSLHGGTVLLVATPLHNDLESVEVVRRRVLVAASARDRVRDRARLRCSRRCSRAGSGGSRWRPSGSPDGRFDEPVVDAAPDELGQLARAFERMRLRLASLDRARGEFIANASHELRTPLFSLAGFLELLGTDEELDADDARRVPRRDARAGRPADEARDRSARPLADRRRPARGRRREPRSRPSSASCSRPSSGRASRRPGTTLELDAGARRRTARGDEARVLQIGRILVENALVHTPPGTTVIASRPTPTAAARRCRSTDDGPGIPDDAPAGRLRALLPARRHRGLGQRPRPRDRARARRADGRPDRARVAARAATRFTLVLPADGRTRPRDAHGSLALPKRDEIRRRNLLSSRVRASDTRRRLCASSLRSPAPAACSSPSRAAAGTTAARRRFSSASRSSARRCPRRSSSRSRCSRAASRPSGSTPSAHPGVVTVFSYFGAKAGRLDARGGLGLRRRPHRRSSSRRRT